MAPAAVWLMAVSVAPSTAASVRRQSAQLRTRQIVPTNGILK
jgi:hypothetical protein